ncbi:hypothetical protein [Streptomyces sp. NPDC002779]|uniref:hypothetical protein n=1 Tax=Streptomyces sp. NPDC002779 TaxID=3364664 RepID=UPI0036CC47AD
MNRIHTARRALRTACVAGAVAVAGLAAAPQAGAAAPASCVTESDTRNFGRGEISLCVDNGTARVTGWVEDLLPGGGFGTPDGGCVGWYITWQTAAGDELEISPIVCGHFQSSDRYDFDYDPSASEGGPRNITGVVEAHLGTVWI